MGDRARLTSARAVAPPEHLPPLTYGLVGAFAVLLRSICDHYDFVTVRWKRWISQRVVPILVCMMSGNGNMEANAAAKRIGLKIGDRCHIEGVGSPNNTGWKFVGAHFGRLEFEALTVRQKEWLAPDQAHRVIKVVYEP